MFRWLVRYEGEMTACPAEETILAFAEGRLRNDTIQLLEQHASTCGECADLITNAVAVIHEPKPRTLASSQGHYTLITPIGYGSTGVVYCSRNMITGQLVALKLLRALEPRLFEAVRREIRLLLRLHHPGVVKLLDHGVDDDGRPWYAMELLDQGSLAGRNQRYWAQAGLEASRSLTSRERIPEVLRLGASLAATLSTVHSDNVVHGDLKPQNVLMRNDVPVLVDFGLSALTAGSGGREVPDLPSMYGTPAYMSPEQILGEVIDARTDLYALGCILYELLTGRPPFIATQPSEILHQHLRNMAPAPSQLVDGVPPSLDSLVLHLLAKRRRDRIGHADEVVEQLVDLGAVVSTTVHRRQTCVYRPELAGRDPQLRQIVDVVQRSRGEGGSILLVAGESGIGKTYLALEAARRCRGVIEVVIGVCAPTDDVSSSSRGLQLQPLRPLLDRMIAYGISQDADSVQQWLGDYGSVLGELDPRFATLAKQVTPSTVAPLHGAPARDRLFSALRIVIRAFVHKQPLLWIIDDLQWADEWTLTWLRTLDTTWLQDTPLVILATYRSEDVTTHITGLLSSKVITEISLERLHKADITNILADMLAVDAPSEELVDIIVHNADGNPLFATEFLRGLVAQNLLPTVSGSLGGTIDTLALPRTLREIIECRFHRLSHDAQQLIMAAAVLGREFPMVLALQIAKLAAAVQLDVVAELTARQIIELVEEDWFRFSHIKLREVVYEYVPLELKAALHQTVALAVEGGQGHALGPFYVILAHHWDEAGDTEKALFYSEAAACYALEHALYCEATRLLRRAIILDGRIHCGQVSQSAAHRQARWEQGLARAAFGVGNLQSMEHHTRRAMELLGYSLPKSMKSWFVLLVKEGSLNLFRHCQMRLSSRTTAMSRRNSVGVDFLFHNRYLDDSGAAVVALLSHKFFCDSQPLPMLATSLLSCNLAGDISKGFSSFLYSWTAVVLGLLRFDSLATRSFARAARVAASTGNRSEEAFILLVESVFEGSFGRWAAAELAAQTALTCLHNTYDPVTYELALIELGHVEYHTGRYKSAFDRYQCVAESAASRGNRQHLIWARYSGAASLIALGRLDEARPVLENTLAELASHRELQSEINSQMVCRGLVARLLALQGDLSGALGHADDALKLILLSVPTGFPTLIAFSAIADVYANSLATADSLDRERLLKQSTRLRRSLLIFSTLFPVARPTLLRCRAHKYRAAGELSRARHLYRESITVALRMHMHGEAVLAQVALNDTNT